MKAVRETLAGMLGLVLASLLLLVCGVSPLPVLAMLLGGVLIALGWALRGMLRAGHEVVALQHALQAAREQGRNVQQLLDAIPHPIYVKDAESRYIMLNAAFCRERGQTRESLLGKSSFELAPNPTTAALAADEDASVLAGQSVCKEEHNTHPLTGKPRFRLVSKMAGTTPAGQRVVVGANIDVTHWRQAERVLHLTLDAQSRARAQLQAIFDAMPNPVFVKDEAHRYLMINRACERMLGHSPAVVLGHAAHEFLDPGMADALEGHERMLLLKSPGTIFESELHMSCEGEARCFHTHKVVGRDTEGRRIIVGSLSDVTSLQEAEVRWLVAKEQAERANQAKSLFLANMSHELRTPLHGILGFARLGEERAQSAERDKLHHFFEHIMHSGDRLLGLLDDLLDLSKLEAGHADVDICPLDLDPVIAEAIEEFEALMDRRGLRVLRQKNSKLHAAADAKRIGQVLRNLLSNAIKFSPDGSSISVQLRDTRLTPSPYYSEGMPGVELVVADEGIGIPAGELESVFEKFVQSSATASGAGGTGLGLAICREIVRAHKGELFARNRARGGAEFILRLPAAVPTVVRSAA
jgi:PAS domain S-box-containing protein